MSDFLWVRLSEKEFDRILTELKRLVYDYNIKISRLGFWLKPYHISYYTKNKQYYYIGRYWFSREYTNKKYRYVYLGTKKPLQSLPDPPEIPRVTIIKIDNNIYISRLDFEILNSFLYSVEKSK